MEFATDKELRDIDISEEKEDLIEHTEVIDYKMVTFSLSGKDYGIDIMDVKEIAKASRFTFVPNAAPFVLGVYNLRGDIIPIIDLRIFFHIATKRREPDTMESLLILSVGELIFGVVVDSIDKVVGISKKNIQPPHPIFGDINIKYILGVVENMNRLYILLDVQRMFGKSIDVETDVNSIKSSVIEVPAVEENVTNDLATQAGSVVPLAEPSAPVVDDSLDISFIAETLKTFKKYYVSVINENWIQARFAEWKEMRPAADVQLQNESDADAFLSSFFSPCGGRLWDDTYISSFVSLLPQSNGKQIVVWNPGCGLGYETYSLACVLKETYPKAMIRIYANDTDLLGIANAPNMTFTEDTIPSRFMKYMTKSVNGNYGFSQEIKDLIMFEYHDCTHDNPYPDVDFIVARDMLSFLPPDGQAKLIADFTEKLKPTGVVILGANECMPKGQGWLHNAESGIVSFTRE